jgi:hypothetical protein
MLASGVAVGVFVWRVLMLEPGPTEGGRLPATERLSHQDQRALDRLLSTHGTRP